MNLYVGNLPYSTTEEQLQQTFNSFGSVNSVQIIIDRRTNRSRGYGFVEMSTEDGGKKAIEALNGSDFEGRSLRVDQAHNRAGEVSHNTGKPRTNNNQTPRAAANDLDNNASGGVMGFLKGLFN